MSTNTELVTTFNQLNTKQVLRIKDMIDKENYLITRAERTTTKYGDAIMLELGQSIFYLPQKFNALTDKDVEDLSTGMYLISKIPVNNDRLNTFYRLEIKVAPTMKDYYSFSDFTTFK